MTKSSLTDFGGAGRYRGKHGNEILEESECLRHRRHRIVGFLADRRTAEAGCECHLPTPRLGSR